MDDHYTMSTQESSNMLTIYGRLEAARSCISAMQREYPKRPGDDPQWERAEKAAAEALEHLEEISNTLAFIINGQALDIEYRAKSIRSVINNG